MTDALPPHATAEPVTTAALMASIRNYCNEQEKSGQHSPGTGLNDAERSSIRTLAAQANLLGDGAVHEQLLNLFADRAKRWNRPLPAERLPEALVQLAREYTVRSASSGSGKQETRILKTVKEGAPGSYIAPAIPESGHKVTSLPAASAYVPIAKTTFAKASEEETETFVAQVREAFAQSGKKLSFAYTVTSAQRSVIENVESVAGYRMETRKNLVATFEKMAKQCDMQAPDGGKKFLRKGKLPEEHLPNLVRQLEGEMDRNSPMVKDSSTLAVLTVRLGAFPADARKIYPAMPQSVIMHATDFANPVQYLQDVQSFYTTSKLDLAPNAKYFLADKEVSYTTNKNLHVSKVARAPKTFATADTSALQSAWGMRVAPLQGSTSVRESNDTATAPEKGR